MKRLKGFTLAEVLITLAIIGVVAAISIPSVISNSQQQEFKTGLRKAVSVLNSAITMNMAIDGESPYDNKDLFRYLQRHMSIIETYSYLHKKYRVATPKGTSSWGNAVFYTTDCMRFEFYDANDKVTGDNPNFKLYESPDINPCLGATVIQEVTEEHIENYGKELWETCGACVS